MSKEVVAKRYATALFEIAQEKQTLEAVEQDIRVLKEVFSSNKGILTVLTAPKLSVEKKKTVLAEVLAGVNSDLLHTLFIMIDNKRIDTVLEFATAFIALSNEAKGVAEALVYSVRPLSEEEKAALSSTFASKVGKANLQITNIIDPSLIGGVKLRIGNRIFDGTISRKLERIGRSLVSQ